MGATVESAIRSAFEAGEVLTTLTGKATFEVGELAPEGLWLLFGPKKTRTLLNWQSLEGIPDFLQDRGWTVVAANRVVGNDYGLDGYLKQWVKRQTANYVAVVLERAGIVELDRERPARVRLARRRNVTNLADE
jgi:hypothetical protein